MGYDKRFKRFKEFVEAAPTTSYARDFAADDAESFSGMLQKKIDRQNKRTADNRAAMAAALALFKKKKVNEDGAGGGAAAGAAGGAPANSAGAGHIAGLGVPAGSKFGEPGGPNPLGGYTSKKKRKHYKEAKQEPIIDTIESALTMKEWDQIPKPIEGGGMFPEAAKLPRGWEKVECLWCRGSGKEPDGDTCTTCGGEGWYYEDEKGHRHFSTDVDEETTLKEELSKSDVEKAAAAVHDQWMDNQKKSGHIEHKSPDGKEDYMVPYDELKEKSKKLDRDAVKATLDALKLDEVQKRYERVRCSYCRGTGQDWEDPCAACAGRGYILYDRLVRKDVPMWDNEVLDNIDQNELMEEREMFAGSPVFEVDTDKWMKSRFGKNRYHRYSRYVGEDDKGEEIRQHGRTKRKDDIILKDQATGAMTYFLRRKKTGR